MDLDAAEVTFGGSTAVVRGARVDGTTKGGRYRTISLDRDTVAVLREHHRQQAGVTNAFAMLRLLPASDGSKDVEILTLRHQIRVLQRQLGEQRLRFDPSDQALPAALRHRLPRDVLRGLRLLVRPDTVLR